MVSGRRHFLQSRESSLYPQEYHYSTLLRVLLHFYHTISCVLKAQDPYRKIWLEELFRPQDCLKGMLLPWAEGFNLLANASSCFEPKANGYFTFNIKTC